MVWGPESGSKTAHITSLNFTILPWGGLRSRIWSQDGSFYLFTRGWSEVQNQVPRRLLYLFTLEWSEVQNQGPRQLILAFYLFTWGWNEVQNQSKDSSFYHFTFLPFYLWVVCGSELGPKTAHYTFLPGGGLRSRISPKTAYFTLLFTFLPGGSLRSRIRSQDGSFYLFTYLPGGGLISRIRPQKAPFLFYIFILNWGWS